MERGREYMAKPLSVTQHYINFRPSVQAWMACCCTFPEILLPMVQKLSSGFEFGLAPSFLGASLRYAHPGRRDGSVFA